MDKFIKQDCIHYLEKIDLSPLYGKRVLITGANGLIGTYLICFFHLANITRNAGIDISAVSRSAPCDKLREIFRDGYTFYSMNLASPGPHHFPQRADYIIHGATYAQPGKFLKNYHETIHLNTTATENLLKKAKEDGATFLFLSSSEIYGEPDDAHIPTPEDYPGLCSPVSVRAIYSESKRMGETLCYAYKAFDKVNAKIARISMSYGPGVELDDERVLSNFMKQALLEKRVVMLDDGSKKRTFCYIADSVLMLLNILLYGSGFVYNVGGGDTITIRQLAEEICALTGSTLSAVPAAPATSQDIKVSPPVVELDTSKVRSEFNLPPPLPFKEGLARTLEWNIARRQL